MTSSLLPHLPMFTADRYADQCHSLLKPNGRIMLGNYIFDDHFCGQWMLCKITSVSYSFTQLLIPYTTSKNIDVNCLPHP